jgi:2-C-methyl-D-erythritol 4-phosphate cytidylyltransferase
MKTAALIVAGGSSMRFGGEVPKQFVTVCGRPLLSWTIDRFDKSKVIDDIVVVAHEDYLLYVSQNVIDPFTFHKVSKIVSGGESRQESVLKGLRALSKTTDLVAIHDGARPLVSEKDIAAVISEASKSGAAMLAAPASDTVKRVKDGYIIATLNREWIYLAQTPQVFRYDLILKAHEEAALDTDLAVTDDASLAETAGMKVRIVESTSPNFKVTSKDDITLIETFLGDRAND